MNCYKCKKIIDNMHNDCINNNELQSMLHHIETCESCRTYYNVMEQMLNDLSSFDEKELPQGFHNKLHFALKREVKAPKKQKTSFSKGVKLAAIGAFSVLLIVAAISILPGRMGINMMSDMAMEESMDAPAEAESNGMAMTAMEKEATEETQNYSSADGMRDTDSQDKAEDEMLETEPAENPFAYGTLSNGESIVLIIEANDIEGTYDALLEYMPDPLPDTRWMLTDMEEPAEYKQLRSLMNMLDAQYIAELIVGGYSQHMEKYYVQHIEYDDYEEETADLQDIGYVFIIIK